MIYGVLSGRLEL